MINSQISFEILISTMFRSDLLFLEKMFPKGNFEKFSILIVNQTDAKRQLKSPYTNVRVINTEERGLPQSRNMAIRNAIGDICLIADDDVLYKEGFESIILQGYIQYSNAAVITFQLEDTEGTLYRKYPNNHVHDNQSIHSVNSVVISFKRKSIIDYNILYNPHFGLGSIFESADEYVFMKDVLKAGLPSYFIPKILLIHSNHSSGRDQGSDRLLYARGALSYKYYGALSYLWVVKYLFFIVRKRYITPKYAFAKAKIAYAGIKKYKSLLKTGEERR